MTILPGEPVVSTSWLADHLGEHDLVVLDCSWYLPTTGRDAYGEYVQEHIPEAVYFDLDRVSDSNSPLPHSMPGADYFGSAIGSLGISNTDSVIVYDGSGINLSAPRAWWMFRAFGHQRVALLDGGIRKWRAESRALESGVVARPPARFNAALRHRQFRDMVAMRANLSDHQEQVLDARSSGRFNGTEVEPRKGLRGGHIPGSRNLPYTELVAPDGTLHTAAQLRELFTASGIDLSRPIVTTCGSGVTACALLLGLSLAGAPETALYDGSWTEWGGQADTPVEPDVRQ